MINLLSNSMKFTPRGGRIRIWCDFTDALALMHVSDTGSGIPADRIEEIFHPFVQVQRKLTDSTAGVALGLAISRDLARAMGGDLTVESTEGEGSTFTCAIPRAASFGVT